MENHFDKWLLIRRDWQFNITVEFDLFMNPLQNTRFSNSCIMPIPSNILKHVCSDVGLDEMVLNIFD